MNTATLLKKRQEISKNNNLNSSYNTTELDMYILLKLYYKKLIKIGIGLDSKFDMINKIDDLLNYNKIMLEHLNIESQNYNQISQFYCDSSFLLLEAKKSKNSIHIKKIIVLIKLLNIEE